MGLACTDRWCHVFHHAVYGLGSRGIKDEVAIRRHLCCHHDRHLFRTNTYRDALCTSETFPIVDFIVVNVFI